MGAAIAFFAPILLAQAPSKTTPPSGLTPAQAEERIKQLESRADAAEKAAASAAMEKDYITRVQKQCESYYERAFNTQVAIIGIISLLIGLALWIAARFSLDFFDRRVQAAVTKVQDDVTATMKIELDNLRRENASQIENLSATLKKEMKTLDDQLALRSDLGAHFHLGFTFSLAKGHEGAITSFREAVKIYKKRKLYGIQDKAVGVRMLDFLFGAIKSTDPQKFPELAAAELKTNASLYDGLDDELAQAALTLPDLAPTLRDRKKT